MDAVYCSQCGQALAVGDRFCRSCGKEQSAQPTEQTTPTILRNATGRAYCSNCQEYVRPDAQRCKHCGALFGQPAAAAPVPVKRTSPWAFVLVTLLVLGGCYWLVIGPALRMATLQATRAQTADVTYRVSGYGGSLIRADLTYSNAGGDTEQQNDVATPWTKNFAAHGGQFLYISAQNQGESGFVRCEILVNGTVVKTSQSEGAYAIATCSGSL